MSRETKTYKGNKKDQFTIVLEDLRHQFGVFGEALQFTNQNIVEMKADLSSLSQRTGRLEIKVDVLSSDVYVLKNDVAILKSDVAVLKSDVKEMKTILRKHDGKFDDHEERINRLETA